MTGSENTRLKAEVRDLRQLLLTGKSQELPDEVAGAAGMLAALNRRNQLLKVCAAVLSRRLPSS